MTATADWVDLLDPDEAAIRDAIPAELYPHAVAELARRAAADERARPVLEGHGDYLFGVFLVPVAVPHEDRVFYREVDLVLGRDWVVTVRKTPPREEPFDPAPVRAACSAPTRSSPDAIAYHLVDEVAEAYIDAVDALEDEIDELEDHIHAWPPERVHARLSDLRHQVLRIRRTLSPTRDAVRALADGRVGLVGDEPFERSVEIGFRGAYDKLLRANEGLEYARDLMAAVRDYHQSKIAQEQNDVIKKLTVIASLVLVPTFIVGVYGQNFEHMPELGWQLGYLFSWGLIALSALALLAFFRWRRWI